MRKLLRASGRRTKKTKRGMLRMAWGVWEAYVRAGLSVREVAQRVDKPLATVKLGIERHRALVKAGDASPVSLVA